MTKDTFKRIMQKYGEVVPIMGMKALNMPEPMQIWGSAFGLDSAASQLHQYDMFMAAFFNPDFLSVMGKTALDIRIYEFWNTRNAYGMLEDDLIIVSDICRSFRFMANAFQGLMEGSIPSKKFNGWKFQLDVIWKDDNVVGNLYVQFKRNEYFPLTRTRTGACSIQCCRNALITFLQTALLWG